MGLVEVLPLWLSQPESWIAFIVALTALYLIRFVSEVRSLPPGPRPLPLIGNILELRKPRPLFEKAVAWSKQYGDPFTVWIGPRPVVMAGTKESFKDISGPLRNLLAGRMQSNLTDLQSRGNVDIAFGDFSPGWDVLRRLAHVAMRKYAQSEQLAQLVTDLVDEKLDEVLEGKKETQSGVIDFVEEIINNTLAVSAFGGSFTKGDPTYEKMREANRRFETDLANGLPSDTLPILKYIYFRKEREGRKMIKEFGEILEPLFQDAMKTWSPDAPPRHFADVLLNDREKFLKDDRASTKYLSDNNLSQTIFDIFGAGTGTTKNILGFAFLHFANDPQLQEGLRAEVFEAIGTRRCQYEDRSKMPKVDSFLQEIIRFHPAAPLALPRKALADVTVNGRFIPKNCAVMINLYQVNRDPDIWGPDADEFNPLRFVNATKDQVNRGATSFGIGARSCPGEKMALADMFYAIVRALQKVKFSCPNGPGTADLDCGNQDIFLDPKRQALVFTRL